MRVACACVCAVGLLRGAVPSKVTQFKELKSKLDYDGIYKMWGEFLDANESWQNTSLTLKKTRAVRNKTHGQCVPQVPAYAISLSVFGGMGGQRLSNITLSQPRNQWKTLKQVAKHYDDPELAAEICNEKQAKGLWRKNPDAPNNEKAIQFKALG